MTNPKEKTREELQAEIEDGKKKIRQFENREKMLRQKLSKEERRTRSHRLIVRGAVFESIVPEAKNMTDEEAAHHNAVFVGRDEDGVPRYAHQRGTAGNFRLDVKGSDKAFNFCYRGEGERLFVFEAPIDLLSFLCLFKKAGKSKAILRWVAWEIKPLCAFSLTARTSRPYISALTATKPETTLAAALWSLCRRT